MKNVICAKLGALGNEIWGHDPMRVLASPGKGEKNQDFPIIPWKPGLGVEDCTDFTYLMEFFKISSLEHNYFI